MSEKLTQILQAIEDGDDRQSSNPGVAGIVLLPDESPVTGIRVGLYDASGRLVKAVLTDEDGFYQIVYKHKGKPATYEVRLPGTAPDAPNAQQVTLKGNALVEVNFVLPAE